jgi:hypothetical protein
MADLVAVCLEEGGDYRKPVSGAPIRIYSDGTVYDAFCPYPRTPYTPEDVRNARDRAEEHDHG